MLTKISGGTLYDPMHGVNGEKRDIYFQDGRICAAPDAGTKVDHTIDASGSIVMAGAIDPHSHIGGGKVNIGRMLMPEDHLGDPVARTAITRAGTGHASPCTLTTGYRYAEMGFTAAFEPAMLCANARQAHMEMADIPIIDKGAYVLLGNEDIFLRMLAENRTQAEINDYVAWNLNVTQAMGVKVVNPGGINAFKFNQRRLDLEEKNTAYGCTPRQVLTALGRACQQLGISHPLHIHGCNLGVPGSVETTLDTIEALAAEGIPAHLTHVQFHSYGTEGDKGFSSGAPRVAELVNRHKHISIDIGQILFGQTCTMSGDTMRQYAGSGHASPKKYVVMDIECEAGCGVVPFRYRDKSFVHAVQWTVGLETFLLVKDPWQLFLTTDHPNGAPFHTYPHLMRLLMDRSFRNDALAHINKVAAGQSVLSTIDREYSLYEIAILTRASPAKSLGLRDQGHLGVGASADITVYRPQAEVDKMFAAPSHVFKSGHLVAQDGRIVAVPTGLTTVHTVKPDYDRSIEKYIADYFDRYHTIRMNNFVISGDEIEDIGMRVQTHPSARAA
jgi:formylmethanofuran dehydrogenase subunit A